jgi:xanthine dehydrogenase YagT iron-sulfur-binding subunit
MRTAHAQLRQGQGQPDDLPDDTPDPGTGPGPDHSPDHGPHGAAATEGCVRAGPWPISRRGAMQAGAALAGASLAGCAATAGAPATGAPSSPDLPPQMANVELTVNGRPHRLRLDTRTSVLDMLRENLQLKGSKKGCDHGQCGACTVLVDGRRTNACLTLAVMQDGRDITTIEGLAKGEQLHPVQAAFLQRDGFQCGYCTPGQICSSVGMLAEARAGMPSHVSRDLQAPGPLTDDEIRERMSGNLCRCSAYPNIVAAIRDVAGGAA